MTSIIFLKCPKCQNQYWVDIPNLEEKSHIHWRCSRCSYIVKFGNCKNCGKKKWEIIQGIDIHYQGQKPWYRVKCTECNRVIGVYIDSIYG